jgi:anti-sigma B factor antagonist
MAVTDTPVYPAVKRSHRASWVLLREEDKTVITVDGDLDVASAGAFVAALAALAAGASDAVIDMAGVDFIDSSTMRALVRAHELFESFGLRLTVRSPSRPVRRMLGLCQLDEVINTA